MNMINVALLLAFCAMMPVISSSALKVVASVRGRKIEVEAETVEEFLGKIESQANLEVGQQSVLFRGKVLSTNDILSEVGVASGDVLMVVKGKRQRAKPESVETPMARTAGVADEFVAPGSPGIMDSDAYAKAIQSGANPEDVKKAMKAMENLLDSDFIDDFFADEERLETSRKQMLENIDQYDQMMPGFKEQARSIASSPEKWRGAMLQAKEQIKMMKQQRDSSRGTATATSEPSPFSQPSSEASSSVDDVDEAEEQD